MALGLGLGIPYFGSKGGVADAADGGGLAAALLGSETNGLAFYADDMSLAIRDTTTPANVFLGDANSKLTYASPSTKYILNSSGIYVPDTTLRCEYDASGNPLGIRIEEARTNLLLRSTELDNASWTKTRSSVTPNATTAPDGTLSADKIVDTAVSGTHIVSQTTTNGTSTYTVSAFVKASELTFCSLEMSDNTTGSAIVGFNLSTGALDGTPSVGASSWSSASASIRPEPNGWYRVSLTATRGAGTQTVSNLGVYKTSATRSYTGSGTEGLFAWALSLEAGGMASSVAITAGSTVTKVADSISLLFSQFPNSFTDYSWFAELTVISGAAPSNARVIGSDTSWTPLYITQGSGGLVGIFTNTALASQSPVTAIANRTRTKLASSRTSGGGLVVTANGAAASTATNAAQTAPSAAIFFGSQNGSGQANIWLRSVVGLPRAWSSAEAQAVTAL